MKSIKPIQSNPGTWGIWIIILATTFSSMTFANTDITHAGPISGGLVSSADQDLPEIPLIYRNVTGIINDEFTRPHIPPLRPTRDGRLGVRSQGYNDGIALVLLNPEKMDQPTLLSQRGASIISQPQPYIVTNELLKAPLGFQNGALCEPHTDSPSARQNPYSCGTNLEQDCYDIVYVGGESLTRDLSELSGVINEGSVPDSNQDRLYSAPMTVTISNPKTPEAYISAVAVNQSAIKRAQKPYQTATFEHVTPADGRLLVMRAGNQTLTWFNENTQQYVTGSYDNVYSVGEDDSVPCDIEQWSHLYPISHAPYHDLVKSRYDFAANLFRDPMGHIIRDGVAFKGSYPWIDMHAKNLTLTTLPGSQLYDKATRYPARCVIDGCDESLLQDIRNQHQGFIIIGSWTQGKTVLLDGILNDIDFEFGQSNEQHSYVKLYQEGTGTHGTETGEVRMGSTRQVGNELAPIGTSRNTTAFDSVEARFNYLQNLIPIMPKDVVWLASSGRHTDEFAFDDYVDPNAFIISNMVGALNFNEGNHVFGRYYDGWNAQQQAFTDPVYVQNSSTALRAQWIVPNYGEVHNGRLEPAAVGGIRGKGIWLDGQDSFVQYDIEAQPRRIDAYPWFVSLFIESRADSAELPIVNEQALIAFPDGSELTLLGENTLYFRDSQGQIVNQLALPQPIKNMQWHQLGLNISPNGQHIRVYHNGFPLQEWQSVATADPIFQFSAGELLLGKSTRAGIKPFKGWMDEFKVYAHSVSAESACNHAHGTLLALEDDYQGPLSQISDAYSPAQQEIMSRELTMKGSQPFNRYVCYSDNEQELGINPRQLPENTASIGGYINFPEGPLHHDAPRPDSSANQFCLTCHHVDGIPGLSIDALHLNEMLLAKQDPRRQPMQPNATIYGNIPANWLPGSPGYHQNLANEGAFIDEWVLAQASALSPEIKGFTLVSAETEEDILPLTDGMTLDINELRTSRLNIRAVTNGLTRQVTFSHNGSPITVNHAPFALFGRTNDQFNAGILEPGLHTLSAETGLAESQLSITFTVLGHSQHSETGDDPVATPIDRDSTLLDWIVDQAHYFLQRMIDLFNSLITAISNGESSLFISQESDQLDDVDSLGIYLNSAIRDGVNVTLVGRVVGIHSGSILINDQQTPINNNEFFYQSNTDINEFLLQLNNSQGDQEEVRIRFDKQRVINGAEIRLNGEEGLYGYLSQTISKESPAIEALIEDALSNTSIIKLAEGGLDVDFFLKEARVNDISFAIAPGQVPSSDLTIDGAIRMQTVDLDARLSAAWCFEFWGAKICPLSLYLDPLSLGIDELDIPFSLTIIPGSEVDASNQLLGLENIDVAIDFDKARITIGFIPSWLTAIIFDPLKEIIFPMVEQPIADSISQEITNTLEPMLALIPDGFNIGLMARFHEINKSLNLPETLEPLAKALTDGAGVELSINNLQTQPEFNHIGLDIGLYSLTADDQVHFGYRISADEADSIALETLDSQADVQVLLKEKTLNKALATFAQESILDASVGISLTDLLLTENPITASEEGDLVLSVDLPSAPYLSVPESDDITARIHVDNINFSLHTSEAFLDEYAEDEVVALLDLAADLVLDIRYEMVEGEWKTTVAIAKANLVSISAFDLDIPDNMTEHLLERLSLAIMPQIIRQMTHADVLPPFFGLDKMSIKAGRPDSTRNDLLIELQLAR